MTTPPKNNADSTSDETSQFLWRTLVLSHTFAQNTGNVYLKQILLFSKMKNIFKINQSTLHNTYLRPNSRFKTSKITILSVSQTSVGFSYFRPLFPNKSLCYNRASHRNVWNFMEIKLFYNFSHAFTMRNFQQE